MLKKKIFISYKRVDKEKVLLLKRNIEQVTGVDCWVDLEGIETGKRFDSIIVSAINQAEIVLFMYSAVHRKIKKEDVPSDWTMRELNFAWKKKKRVVLVNLDGSPLTDLFELHFGLEQQVDAQSEESMRNLVSDIRKWLRIDPIPILDRISIKPTSFIKDESNRFLTFYRSFRDALVKSKRRLGIVMYRCYSLCITILLSIKRNIIERKKLFVGLVVFLSVVVMSVWFQKSIVNGLKTLADIIVSRDTIKNDTIVADTIYEALISNMVFVEGGTFIMGATEEQKSEACKDEYPATEMSVRNFYLSKYEVTQSQWNHVMKKSYPQKADPSCFKGKDLPVERVSWEDCQLFIKELNRQTGESFRLPTEAEWEYAARGGKYRKGYVYSGGDKLEDVGWYTANSGTTNSGRKTHIVGGKKPNELGIYDMSGNVSEWCSDKYKGYKETHLGKDYNFRGGCFFNHYYWCRSAKRGGNKPAYVSAGVGLRIAADKIIRNKRERSVDTTTIENLNYVENYFE